MLFVAFVLLFLITPVLRLHSSLLRDTITSIQLATGTAVLVGLVPFLAYFLDVVEVLLGWQGGWSNWNRLAYALR